MSLPTDPMEDAFHALAQRLMTMRITLETSIESFPNAGAAHETLESCMAALEQLTQDLRILREIACVEPPAQTVCDGAELLRSCVEDMAPVALACGVHLRLDAAPSWIQCDKTKLARALFVLLDELTASSAEGANLHLMLRRGKSVTHLEVSPALGHSMRQALCHSLLCAAGGEIISAENGLRVAFRNATARHIRKFSLADK
jgi:hypothetical protein